MDTEREPDFTEDPRGDETGQGYPEENPAGSNPDEASGATAQDDTQDPPAPDTSSDEDSGPGHATGNPDAAG